MILFSKNIQLIKSNSKDIYNVIKENFLFIKQSCNKGSQCPQKYETEQLFSSLIIIIINVSWAENQHISMISERSCDTEDWSNDDENSDLHYMNKIQNENIFK